MDDYTFQNSALDLLYKKLKLRIQTKEKQIEAEEANIARQATNGKVGFINTAKFNRLFHEKEELLKVLEEMVKVDTVS